MNYKLNQITKLINHLINNQLINNSFHVTENYAVDIMHDLLEGVCKYDIGLMLNKMIFSCKYFTLNTLNDRIELFNYGTIDIQNRPLISVDSLKPTGTLLKCIVL